MRIRKAVIPAAGQGTRLLPLTKSQPKETLPIGRKPVIQHVVDEILSAGIERILIITNQDKPLIKEHFDKNKSLSRKMSYVYQEVRPDLPYGLAYAIGLAEDFVGTDPFLVCLGDCIIGSGDQVRSDLGAAPALLERLIHTHVTHKAAVTIAFEEVSWEKVSRYGIARPRGTVEEEFQLDGIVEKPPSESAPSNLAVAARYVFEPEILHYIRQTKPGVKKELQITDSIGLLLRDERPVWGVPLRKDEVRYDIGGFAGYFRAFFDFAMTDEEVGEEFRHYARRRSNG
ncbi:UTP--glucose-1-phosphate uridylyltransferase [Candidatus Poribacteria bacterium]